MWHCKHCKEDNEESFDSCWNCQQERGDAPSVPGAPAKSTSRHTSSPSQAHRSHSSPINRYRDAYRVGTLVVGFGSLLKGIGWALGGIALISGLAVSRQGDSENWKMIFGGVILAVILWAIFFFFGVLLTAIGEILRATLDTAVHTSPLLSDKDRGEAMGL